jgi:hypothetical protein
MVKCFQVWAKRIQHLTDQGHKLPPTITRADYEEALRSRVYTMPMHLWLFATVPERELVQELQEAGAYGFHKSPERSLDIVRKWREAAFEAVHHRNAAWIARMRIPGDKEMLASCERLMPGWVAELGKAITSLSPTVRAGGRFLEASYRRWGAEGTVLGRGGRLDDPTSDPFLQGERQLSDWRKITRFFREYELASLSSPGPHAPHPLGQGGKGGGASFPYPPPSNKGTLEGEEQSSTGDHWACAAILSYLYHASNQLKHTSYANVDPELFLFLAHALLEMLAARPTQVHLVVGPVPPKSTSTAPPPPPPHHHALAKREVILDLQEVRPSAEDPGPAYAKLMDQVGAGPLPCFTGGPLSPPLPPPPAHQKSPNPNPILDSPQIYAALPSRGEIAHKTLDRTGGFIPVPGCGVEDADAPGTIAATQATEQAPPPLPAGVAVEAVPVVVPSAVALKETAVPAQGVPAMLSRLMADIPPALAPAGAHYAVYEGAWRDATPARASSEPVASAPSHPLPGMSDAALPSSGQARAPSSSGSAMPVRMPTADATTKAARQAEERARMLADRLGRLALSG